MPERKPKSLWKFVVIGWTLYALFMSAQSYVVNLRAGRPISWEYALFNDFAYAGFWALLTPVILFLRDGFPSLELTSEKLSLFISPQASRLR